MEKLGQEPDWHILNMVERIARKAGDMALAEEAGRGKEGLPKQGVFVSR